MRPVLGERVPALGRRVCSIGSSPSNTRTRLLRPHEVNWCARGGLLLAVDAVLVHLAGQEGHGRVGEKGWVRE
jgi:hypothetical protein